MYSAITSILLFALISTSQGTDNDGYCELNEDGTECLKDTTTNKYAQEQQFDARISFFPVGLARRKGVKIGHAEEVNIGNKIVKVITKSLKPLLFEIPNFLSDEECDHIIKRAKDPAEGEMFSSRAKGGLTPRDEYKPRGKKGVAPGTFGMFKYWDNRKDGRILVEEVISLIHAVKYIILLEEDVHEMFKILGIDALEDGEIDEEEFKQLDTMGIEEYVDILWRTNPRFKERHSEQAWLFMEKKLDPVVHYIRERLLKLTGLSRKIIYGGEMLQVVYYQPFGHYHAHHDSETHKKAEIPCCHQYDGDVLESVGECKLCRYLTFLMYLNDVEEGGETAFPVAGNETYNEDVMRINGNTKTDKYNLSHGCKRASLIVKPKKGQAVLWYNHLRNETDGWMGELDLFSLHGGCDVIKGEKWISNMWIPAPFGNAKDKDSIYLNYEDFALAEAGADGE